MNKFWKERDIDMFKDGVSVPGLTMKYLFSNVPNVHFSGNDIKIIISNQKVTKRFHIVIVPHALAVLVLFLGNGGVGKH